MPPRLEIVVQNDHSSTAESLLLRMTVTGTLCIGRQVVGEPQPVQLTMSEGDQKLVITKETRFSKRHAILDQDNDKIRVRNSSTVQPLDLQLASFESVRLSPGEQFIDSQPIILLFPPATVTAQLVDEVEESLPPDGTVGSGPSHPAPSEPGHTPIDDPEPPAPPLERIRHLLDRLLHVEQGSLAFGRMVAMAAVPILGYRGAKVILHHLGGWREAAHDGESFVWSQRLLDHLLEQGLDYYVHDPNRPQEDSPPGSSDWTSVGQMRIVIAVVRGRSNRPLGVLCVAIPTDVPEPRLANRTQQQQLQLLAQLLAVGLEWLGRWSATRDVFQQFLPPPVADWLIQSALEARLPNTLREQKERQLGILFVDVRDFSAISEQQDRNVASEWLLELQQILMDEVEKHHGMVVEDRGDELLALFGAMHDHSPDVVARAACAAAHGMLARLPEFDAKWRGRIGLPTRLSIGIHTGEAEVRFVDFSGILRFRAIGTNINLASRVETATRQFEVPLLISGDTALHLLPEVSRRRLRRVRLKGIPRDIDLYQPFLDGKLRQVCPRYEAALAALETDPPRPSETIAILGEVVSAIPDDRPALWLFQQAVEQLHRPDVARAMVLRLDEK